MSTTYARYLFRDEETRERLGYFDVVVDSPEHKQLQDAGYLSIAGEQWRQVLANSQGWPSPDTHVVNFALEGVYETLRHHHADPEQEYTKWISSLKDEDLEDEFFARVNDQDSPENWSKFYAADAERNRRLKAGRYLEGAE